MDSIATTENNITIMEFIEDGSICPEEEFIQKEETNCLMKAFNKLTQIEKDVLIRHYGLFNQPIQTFGEIAEENGRWYMEMGATIDERIADGFYFAKSIFASLSLAGILKI